MDLHLAITVAVAAHHEQQDKSGVLFVLHPLRVMLAVSPEARVVAVLHDVVEDTAVSMNTLELAGLIEPDRTALELVTRPDDDLTYQEWIMVIANAPGESGRIARAVKTADIKDNLNRLTPSLAGLEKRYLTALRTFKEAEA